MPSATPDDRAAALARFTARRFAERLRVGLGLPPARGELLGAALTGGETTRPGNLKYQHAVWNNMLALVFDPARLGDPQLFGAEVRDFVDWVQSARLRDAAEPILMPGDPERASRRARAERMPIDAGTMAELDAAAAAVNQARGSALVALSSLAA